MRGAGSQPDWDGEAAANGYHAANYIAYLLQAPGQASIYIAYSSHSYPLQIDVPAPPAGASTHPPSLLLPQSVMSCCPAANLPL